MTLQGETSGFDGVKCTCGKEMKLEILSSNAGYYLGYLCKQCGPWSRETGYYPSHELALDAWIRVTGGITIFDTRK